MKKISYKDYHRDSDYKNFESLFRNIFQKRFNIISMFVKKTGNVLEIGSSTGTFLQIFKEKGWNVLGIESSKSGALANKRGIKTINNYFEKVILPKNNFDLVVMNHTLEHVDDAQVVLKKINLILKKEGILFIDVPNAGGLGSLVLGGSWPYRLPLEHKYQFTKESLEKLLKENHFKVIYWESRSGVFEYANPVIALTNSLFGLKKRFFTDLLTLPYAFLVTALNLGDSMSFVAKKE